METHSLEYKGKQLRYYTSDDNELLLDTKDLCHILSLTDRELGTELAAPYINYSSALMDTCDKDAEFAAWLRSELESLRFGGVLHRIN